MAKFLKGHKLGFKKKHIPWNKGKPFSQETRKKISEKTKEAMARPEIRSKIEKTWFNRRQKPWNFGNNPLAVPSKHRKEQVAGRKKPESCEICGAFGKIEYDHCHQTGKFRGWICHRCNWVLGLVKDNSELLAKLSEYLVNIYGKM